MFFEFGFRAGEMIIPSDRYVMDELESSMYAVQMTLAIKHLQKSDFGGYKCISKNSIGGIEATIRLYGTLKRMPLSTLRWRARRNMRKAE